MYLSYIPAQNLSYKTFRAGNFALRTIHVMLFCEEISAEYEFKSEKFKGGIDRLKIK